MTDFNIDFIGVGACRSGSTWLHDCLSEHPDICMPKAKELLFFSKQTSFTTTNHMLGIEWYQAQFSHCSTTKIKGEVCPNYLIDIESAKRIKEVFPSCKIIIQLRNPVDAVYSLYLKGASLYNFDDSFKDFLKDNPEFLSNYHYDQQVEEYLKHFSKENIHFMFFEDIKEKPQQVINELCNFLGVPTFTPNKLKTPANSNSHYRSKLLRNTLAFTKKLLDSNKITEYLYKKIGISFIGHMLAEKLNTKKGKATPMEPEIREMLKEYYKPILLRLKELTGISLS